MFHKENGKLLKIMFKIEIIHTDTPFFIKFVANKNHVILDHNLKLKKNR